MTILFCGAEPFKQISVEGHPDNISVTLFGNRSIGLGGDVVLRVFLFLALAATLFSRAELL